MRTVKEILFQLNQIGVQNKFLVWPEIKQLPNIMFDDEIIQRFVIGGHPTGFACLIATDRRVILVHKVFMGLIVEDLPYASIHAVRFNYGLVFGEIDIQLIDKMVGLRRISRAKINDFVKFVQYKVQQSQAAQQSMSIGAMRFMPDRTGTRYQGRLARPAMPLNTFATKEYH